jgi:hypothetical protein
MGWMMKGMEAKPVPTGKTYKERERSDRRWSGREGRGAEHEIRGGGGGTPKQERRKSRRPESRKREEALRKQSFPSRSCRSLNSQALIVGPCFVISSHLEHAPGRVCAHEAGWRLLDGQLCGVDHLVDHKTRDKY